MKTLVVYYSHKGSNKYIANKIARCIGCDIVQLKPILNWHLFLVFGITLGNRKVKVRVEDYDRVILCGPIWMGKFIAPLKSFVNKYKGRIKNLVFATCCGSTFEKKMDRFGHGLVFEEVAGLLNGKCTLCEAFPIVLVIPEDKRDDSETFLKTHLNDDNFKGEIKELFECFIEKIK